MVNRREFVKSGVAFCGLCGWQSAKAAQNTIYDEMQREINGVRAADYRAYMSGGGVEKWSGGGVEGLRSGGVEALIARFPALQRLEDAFDRVLREVREAAVSPAPPYPRIWFLYNMGLVIKTAQTCFAIDLNHRRAAELAPYLDFALITHNHDDHWTPAFYKAMNGAGKVVISNFLDNYGVADRHRGGYTRAVKTFNLADVSIRTGLTDHNDYLVDFTSTFEVRIGDFLLYHTGDCSSVAKLNPTTAPDLWCVHPRCGLDPVAAAKKFRPKRTAVLHLNELGHDINRWRWTWADGLAVKAGLEQAGFAAEVPVWGSKI